MKKQIVVSVVLALILISATGCMAPEAFSVDAPISAELNPLQTSATQEVTSDVTAKDSKQVFANLSGGAVWAFASLVAVLGLIAFVYAQRAKLWKKSTGELTTMISKADPETKAKTANYMNYRAPFYIREAISKLAHKLGTHLNGGK